MRPAADLYQPFATHLRVEVGSSENTIRAYLGDIKRFRRWLDAEGSRRGPSTDLARGHRARDPHLPRAPRHRTRGRAPRRQPRHDRPITPKTTHRIISSLRRWFDYLIDVEKLPINQNPARRIRKPKLPKRHPPALTPEQVASLIAAAHERSRSSERVRNWALTTFLYYTGLRVRELCNMRLADIEYENGWPARLRVVGKGNKERTVVLSHDPTIGAEAARALSVWLQHRSRLVAAGPARQPTTCGWSRSALELADPSQPSGVRAVFRSLSGPSARPSIRTSFATRSRRTPCAAARGWTPCSACSGTRASRRPACTSTPATRTLQTLLRYCLMAPRWASLETSRGQSRLTRVSRRRLVSARAACPVGYRLIAPRLSPMEGMRFRPALRPRPRQCRASRGEAQRSIRRLRKLQAHRRARNAMPFPRWRKPMARQTSHHRSPQLCTYVQLVWSEVAMRQMAQ